MVVSQDFIVVEFDFVNGGIDEKRIDECRGRCCWWGDAESVGLAAFVEVLEGLFVAEEIVDENE